MHLSTPAPSKFQKRRARLFALTMLSTALIAVGAATVAPSALGEVSQPAVGRVGASASVLASLPPASRRYVAAIAALTPRQIAAVFGTAWEQEQAVLASLSPANRRYVEAIAALTPKQIAAAFAGM
jgi:hypothetical protein